MKRFAKKKVVLLWLIFFLVLIYYVEIYPYSRNVNTWTELNCETTNHCTRILLIADPQLIGYRNEPYALTPFSVWDSDRYLSNTFYYASRYIKPDIVIFLGDLFDEGSIATDAEFHLYTRRLFKIFLNGPAGNAQHIFLPGDNDIGGEGRDRITAHTLKRFFESMFSQPDVIFSHNITFYKINRLLQTIPKLPQKTEFYDNSKLVIGLSHIPLMFIPSPFVEKVLSKMQPHLLFTAHEHKSMVISTDALTRDDRQIIPITPTTTPIFKVTLGESDMYEIIVPTCSYRMGTDKIGYGYAIIENGELQYTVLWSPSRFPQLKIYLISFCVFVLFLFYKLLKRCRKKS